MVTERECFIRAMRYESSDRRPMSLAGPWPDTLARWRREGLPADTDPHEHLGLKGLQLRNISPATGIFPPYATRTILETDIMLVAIDSCGRTVRGFKDHTSMPEWIDFPVKTPADLKRALDEHFQVDDMNARYPADWEARAKKAEAEGDLVLVDGGCYYGTLRNLAGVENASYLFYDAPELVDELFERYNAVCLDLIRRATGRVRVDVIGFGEDIAYKNGPLVSPVMFRKFLLPRYKKVMDLAREKGIPFTWYDSDGDLRLLIPDYLEVGIDTLAPCEVAAGMDPVELRSRFGRGLRMIGGVDKRLVAKGKDAIDAELARLRPVIVEGGYMPGIDHSVSADISYSNYCYYIEGLKKAVEL